MLAQEKGSFGGNATRGAGGRLQRPGTTLTPFVIAVAALVVAPSIAGLASGATYSSAANHYLFSYPTGWTEEPSPDVDVAILGPAAGGFRPNVVAQHEAEPSARNSSAWLLQYVRNSFDALKAQITVTELQAPRTFTTAAGRLAGDYIFEQALGNLTVRQRQVFFVSEFHRTAFYLTLSDKASTYSSHGSDWAVIVDSFAVTGEPVPSNLLLYAVVGAAVGGAAIAAFALRVRRRTAAERAAMPPPLGVPPAIGPESAEPRPPPPPPPR